MSPTNNSSDLRGILRRRILLLDGGMGTCLQSFNLSAEDFGGGALEGCNEHLVLTPKPRSSLARDYKRMEFWIDPNSGLPKQIRMLDNSERILTVRFYDQETNDKVTAPDKLFEEGPLPRKWDRFVEK